MLFFNFSFTLAGTQKMNKVQHRSKKTTKKAAKNAA